MTQIKIPDLGDFDEVEVVEVHVKSGQSIKENDPIITLETEKAAMDVPSIVTGEVVSIDVKSGDKVSEGDVIAEISVDTLIEHETEDQQDEKSSNSEAEYDLAVIGAGPGGYAAAFRASDLGLKVALIDRNPVLGGVCLNVGCIPSKAFLHAAKVIEDSNEASKAGIHFKDLKIDLEKMKDWKDGIIGGLTSGLKNLAKQRQVDCYQGDASFISNQQLQISSADNKQQITFKYAIIAVGSEPASLDFMPNDSRVIDSTGALDPESIPKKILIIGGGIIGLEMATIYSALGSGVTVVEVMEELMTGTD